MLQVISSLQSQGIQGWYSQTYRRDQRLATELRLPSGSAANKPTSPRLSVERDFNLMTPWMELLRTAKPSLDTRTQKKMMDKSAHHENSPPETPRRLTRALARKLCQSSTEPFNPKQEEISRDAEQLGIQEVGREGKGGKGSRDSVSASPPAIEIYTEHGVNIEPVSPARRSRALAIPTETVILDPTAQVNNGVCSGCGVIATPLNHRDHTGRALCGDCHRIITDEEKELQAEIQERRLKMRDDAILLPPPSTHKIATRIRENFSGKLPVTKKQEGTELLPILELDEPRTMFASYPHLPPRSALQQRPVARRSGPSSGNAGHFGISKSDKPFPFVSVRTHPPIWQNARSAPYYVPVRAQMPPRAITSTSTRGGYPPHLIGGMRSESRRQSPLTLMDIKRRRSMLIDLREVALDLLGETSTVLTQLDRALPKLTAKRGKLVRPGDAA